MNCWDVRLIDSFNMLKIIGKQHVTLDRNSKPETHNS